MMPSNSPIITVPVGPPALSALSDAVDRAKSADPFARVVIIADHRDAAAAVRHWLGARGTINVTVQTGERLADELARPEQKPLSRLLESQAVRLVADAKATELGLEPAGRRRLFRSLATAFREMQERPNSPERPNSHESPNSGDAANTGAGANADAMNRLAESLYQEYLALIRARGYYPPSQLHDMAAAALSDAPSSDAPSKGQMAGNAPAVIYYLPRRLSTGALRLANLLLQRGQCQVICGLTGDADADEPIREMLQRLSGDATTAATSPYPLQQRADAGVLSIVAVPDPEEETRTVIRRIAAASTPFHRTAVIYRQDNPYASLLRQELDFAGIPYSGTDYRSLADTPTGRLALGLVDLAVGVNAAPEPAIDRERLLEWLTATPVRWHNRPADADGNAQSRPVPAARWANLSRKARANGSLSDWQSRLNAHANREEARRREQMSDDVAAAAAAVDRMRQPIDDLLAFVNGLAQALSGLGSLTGWQPAAAQLKAILEAYRWYGPGESDDDRRRIEESIDSVAGLDEWGEGYRPEALQEALREGLQSPVSERGRPVGAGVYVGPPAGIAGGEYDAVYAIGLVEGQFPPRPRANPWLSANPAAQRQDADLERGDFLTAIAAAATAVLCWPAATASRSIAYPSRWLVEAANLLHANAGGTGRLAYDNIASGAGSDKWLTVIQSRADGLRRLANTATPPSDISDYRLQHLIAQPPATLPHHPAIAANARMIRALEAQQARNYGPLSKWDGRVAATARVASIGSREHPISPSALETWANCPYRYFLSRLLNLSAPPDTDDDGQLSALDKGSLVHSILERFVRDGKSTLEELLALADAEFADAEQRGATGYPLLWEIAKEDIRDGLAVFMRAEQGWLGDPATVQSYAEKEFKEVGIAVAGLGEVWFRGKIDRIDVSDDEVRVRDFKTGKPDNYTSKNGYAVANGRALQLPVYAAAAHEWYPDAEILASYCFPLSDKRIHNVQPYTAEQGQDEFHDTLRRIVGMARSGVFPATPDGDGQYANCGHCDFNKLCPTRRRQIWERKAQRDPAAVRPFNELGGKAAIGTNDDADDDAN